MAGIVAARNEQCQFKYFSASRLRDFRLFERQVGRKTIDESKLGSPVDRLKVTQ
jgi:hypothetical protein